MSAGNVRSIGAITFTYRLPVMRYAATPTTKGIRSATISGLAQWVKVQQLSEMVANPATRTTIGGFTGVLATIVMDGAIPGTLTGEYLLEAFDFTLGLGLADATSARPVPFSLNAAYLGSRV